MVETPMRSKFPARIAKNDIEAAINRCEQKIEEYQKQVNTIKGQISILKTEIKHWEKKMNEDYSNDNDNNILSGAIVRKGEWMDSKKIIGQKQ